MFTLGSISFGGISTSGTVSLRPPNTDAQKLEEAQKARAKAERKAEKYNEWAAKIIAFYGQMNDLTEELDELTNEPADIEND